MDTIKLKTPLMVNGKQLTELPYDIDAIDAAMYVRAESYSRKKDVENVIGIEEFDYGFHLYLGFAAIMAADPSIDIADLERIKGRDLMEVARVGRFFTSNASEDSPDEAPSESPDASSKGQSASSQKSTTPASTK